MLKVGDKVKVKSNHLNESLHAGIYTVTSVLLGAVEITDGTSKRVVAECLLERAE